jgi:hypothetical protein
MPRRARAMLERAEADGRVGGGVGATPEALPRVDELGWWHALNPDPNQRELVVVRAGAIRARPHPPRRSQPLIWRRAIGGRIQPE